MDKALLGTDEFAAAAKSIADEYGTVADDKAEKNEKLDAFVDEPGDVNFYTLMILLILDPNQEFESVRSKFKMFLLPCFQILVPFGMAYYFLVEQNLFETNGYCCNHTNIIFRFTGFVTFMYSAWQIIDGCCDEGAKFFLKKAVRQWSTTGRGFDFKAVCMFYLGFLSQQLCCALLLVVTYVIYTTQCDTPLDLLMNCVAINFVLDIDSEWMSSKQQDKAKLSSAWLFKEWRDTCINNGAEVKQSVNGFKSIRSSAPNLLKLICKAGDMSITVGAYLCVFGWTFCPAEY